MHINPTGPSFKGTFKIFCHNKSAKNNLKLEELVMQNEPTGYFYGSFDDIYRIDKKTGGFKTVFEKEMKVSFRKKQDVGEILKFLNEKKYRYWYTNTINGLNDKSVKKAWR